MAAADGVPDEPGSDRNRYPRFDLECSFESPDGDGVLVNSTDPADGDDAWIAVNEAGTVPVHRIR